MQVAAMFIGANELDASVGEGHRSGKSKPPARGPTYRVVGA